MAGFVAGAAALVSAVTVMSPSAAGGQAGVEVSVLEAVLSPAETTAGEEISVRSVGTGCVAGSGERSGLVWAVFPHGEFVWGEHLGWESGDAIASGTAHPDRVGGSWGAWTARFPAPDLRETPPGGGEIGPGSPTTSPVLAVYGPLPFTVDGHQLDFVAKCHSYPANVGDVSISPDVPELGATATVTADDPCPTPHTRGGTAELELWQAVATSPTTSIDTHVLDSMPLADDGSWSTTFDVPTDPDYRYAIAARCVNAEGGQTLGYWLTPFDVQAPRGGPIETPPGFWDDAPVPPATGTTAPVASPAQPVRATPTYTG